MEELRLRLEKEYDARVLGFSREDDADTQRQARERERAQKNTTLLDAKKRRHIIQMHEAEMKQLKQQQKTEYNASKEQLRKVCIHARYWFLI